MAAPPAAAGAKPGRFDILDGKQIRELVAKEGDLVAMLEGAFAELDVDASGALSRAELRPAFLKITKLLGLPPPGTAAQLDELVDVMFTREAGKEGDLAKAEFVAVMKDLLADVAGMLEEDPLFVSVFNGMVLKELAANAEAIKPLVDKAFESLDKDKSGKLSRAELLPVLKLLAGGEEGLPPPNVVEKLEEAIISEFGTGGEELDREAFTALFVELVNFMALALEAEPVLLVEDATVLNGYALRKLVADEKAFTKEADELFAQWDRSKAGKLSKSDVGEGLKKLGLEIGLPPIEAKEAEQIYSELFAAADFDSSGFVDRAEFELLLKALLLSLAAQLEANPVVLETAARPLVPGSQLNDGTDLLEALNDEARLDQILNERFDALDENKNGTLSKSELKPALLRLAQMLGLPPPGSQEQVDRVVDELFKAVVSEDFSEEVDREHFITVTKEILRQVAASLESDPVLTVVLDGSRLRLLLEDSEEFAKLAGGIFESLDTDKSGQLSMEELKPALQELGLALGIPPAGLKEEGDAIVEAAVKEYGHGKKELTPEEFGALLKDILTDIADRLASNPVVVGQSAKVLNGSRIRKILANEAEFKAMCEEFFVDWDRSGTGRLSKVDLTAGIKKLGVALGLPPPKAKDAERVYQQMFINADMDDSGFVDRAEFLEFMRLVFVQVASELENNPIVIEATVVAYSSDL